jgi:hypothetical protein
VGCWRRGNELVVVAVAVEGLLSSVVNAGDTGKGQLDVGQVGHTLLAQRAVVDVPHPSLLVVLPGEMEHIGNARSTVRPSASAIVRGQV